MVSRGLRRRHRGKDSPIAFVTDEIRALIGVPGPRFAAPGPLGLDELRRFVQAVMEADPVHWDAEAARASRYGALVAPPLYVLHAARRAPGTPDPLDRLASDPDWDGLDVGAGFGGLPPIEVPLTRVLNGGTEAELFQLPRVGDLVEARSTYVDIVDREGRSGPMVLATIETEYRNQEGATLARVRNTVIMR
jgi:acyl dehydratase